MDELERVTKLDKALYEAAKGAYQKVRRGTPCAYLLKSPGLFVKFQTDCCVIDSYILCLNIWCIFGLAVFKIL